MILLFHFRTFSVSPSFAHNLYFTSPSLQVLGVGTEYADYSSKTQAYYDFLHRKSSDGGGINSNNTNSNSESSSDNNSSSPVTPNHNHYVVHDDDVVLLMDAYDVLVFPYIQHSARILAEESSAPILFCAERGVYPEITSE